MRRSLRRLLVATILTVAYIFTLPQPTHSELTIHAAWATVPAEVAVDPSSDPQAVPFLLADQFGYVGVDGKVRYRGSRSHGTTLSSLGFSNYPRVPDPVIIQDTRGGLQVVLQTTGYPSFVSERLFTVGTQGMHLAEWSLAGDQIWAVDLPTAVTSLAAGDSIAVAGLLAGGVVAVGPGGTMVPARGGGPQRGVTLALAVSPVAGLRPMRAARLRTCRMPRPAIFTRSPFLRCLVIMPTSSSSISTPCFLVS